MQNLFNTSEYIANSIVNSCQRILGCGSWCFERSRLIEAECGVIVLLHLKYRLLAWRKTSLLLVHDPDLLSNGRARQGTEWQGEEPFPAKLLTTGRQLLCEWTRPSYMHFKEFGQGPARLIGSTRVGSSKTSSTAQIEFAEGSDGGMQVRRSKRSVSGRTSLQKGSWRACRLCASWGQRSLPKMTDQSWLTAYILKPCWHPKCLLKKSAEMQPEALQAALLCLCNTFCSRSGLFGVR